MRSYFNPIRTALLVLSLLTVGILTITWPPSAAARQDWSTVAGPIEGEPRPANSPECVDQPEPPPGEGGENIQPTPRVARESSPRRTVPTACESILEQ